MLHNQTSTIEQVADIVSPEPGSQLWMKWFQDRKGDQPMDAGNIAGDFDMVLTFKALPAWNKAMNPEVKSDVLHFDLRGKRMAPSAESRASK